MALEQNPSLGSGGTGFQGNGRGSAAAMIKELQGLSVRVVNGAAPATNIAVSGIATEDTILAVIKFSAGVPSDVTADATIFSAGNIRLSSDSADTTLQVFFFNKQ